MFAKKKMASYNKVCTDKKRKAGICIRCKNPVSPGCTRCDTCLNAHSKRSREYRSKWKADNVCLQCGKKPLKGRRQCLKHTLSGIVSGNKSRHNVTWTEKDLIQLLRNQNNKCALTGDPVTFDSMLELDHIIPVSRGGSYLIENLRWVTKIANRSKNDLLDSELRELCKKILNTI